MTDLIWIPSQTDAWEAVQVVSSDSATVTVKRRGVDVKIQGSLSHFDSVTQQALDDSVDNLVELEAFNEGIILHHIKKRFLQDKIYTLVGSILIALNPYKSIDMYGTPMIDKIYQRVAQNEDPLPHVFSIAAIAVQNMKQDRKDQAVLISGESGAGKTEATKKILQFISAVCASTGSRAGINIENQILDSNPLLESFGNAKTIRNNNSSRFGKYMEVNFDKKNHIKGCNITAYLLEKSRVVRPGPNERNYHVFYMLLAGANKDMRRDFALKPADQFNYLTAGKCWEIPHRSDATEFEDLLFAMKNLAIDEDSQYSIFKCLAAVLHLGNLLFTHDKEVEGGSKVTSTADCRRIAMLLGLEADSLERSLCSKETVVNGESLLIPLNSEKATDQRDSLAKYVYGRLFEYIVHRVNSSLFRGKQGSSIGVLDIFGFEGEF
jgi:myosin heavy subunit